MTAPADGHYPHQVPIDAYGNGGFRFADMSHRGALLCLPTGMHAWYNAPDRMSDIKNFAQVIENQSEIDVLFIGTGEAIAPVSNGLREEFRALGIVIEGLSTGSAISSYNILLSERRAVAAALIAVERPSRVR